MGPGRVSATIRGLRQLRDKGVVHWLSVLLTVAGGLYVGHQLSEARLWLEWRYAVSNAIQRMTHRLPIAKYTSIVTIGTEEYWGPELSARVPIRRSYLAKLMRAIAAGDAFLIAVDFDLRSPRPDGSQWEIPEFESESRELLAEIRALAKERHLVLPRTIWRAAGHRYRSDPDIWSLEPGLLEQPNIHGGYIALPPDLRQIPLALPLVNAEPMDSFSLAIAKARASAVTDLLAEKGGRENLPFASYIPEQEFPAHPAGEVLSADVATLRQWFAGRMVLIGGAWSSLAADRGPRIDTYATPAGVMPGVFIHANFVEALLDQRAYEALPEWLMALFEIVLVLACVAVFGLDVRARTKLATCMLVLAVLVVSNYLALQNLGRFFDFFIPLVVIMAHVAYEQINEWRHDARAHRNCASHSPGQALAAALVGVILLSTGAAPGSVASHPALRGADSGSVVAQTTRSGVEAADPAKPGGPRHEQDIEPMGVDPVPGKEGEPAAPATPRGARCGGSDPGCETEPMGTEPVVREGVEAIDPDNTGGPRHDGKRKSGEPH